MQQHHHNELWNSVREGDEAAFRLLFEQHWESLYTYASRIIKDKPLIQDIIQGLFIHLWEKHAVLPQVSAVGPYLRNALRNRLLNALRNQHVYQRHVELFRQALRESDDSVMDRLHLKETEQQLLQSINTLPVKMKDVFYLHRIEHLSVAEIAARTGSSEQTIRNQLNTALNRLKAKWNGLFNK